VPLPPHFAHRLWQIMQEELARLQGETDDRRG
jgi:hypothetical protein